MGCDLIEPFITVTTIIGLKLFSYNTQFFEFYNCLLRWIEFELSSQMSVIKQKLCY